MPIDASCYNVAVQCDGSGCNPRRPARGSFNGQNERDALRLAKHEGWRINARTRTALCPTCARRPSPGAPA